MSELETLAGKAGLNDPELLRISRADLPPQAAVDDLRRRYPSAFTSPANVRELPRKDYETAKRDFIQRSYRR
ncbi:hypothetical protein J2D73_19600 [Acetobacter sacchari]|uniref:Uncharacterized protein n=1 Tax=Acetobacter sacchari TaxID=2661687 RepID=A0ABS3M1C6_9PROT|nr:hypothetical protein [Acetobacter sacchari]MBO1361991.1 hypothetical protein [Acetobacter sacchari]